MDEKYRLVFRGEVAEGQHRAVVRRRLVEALKLDDAQAEKLFSGSAVVLKKAVDAKTAARYQALFKKAGAKLRVFAQDAAEPAPAPEADAPTPGPSQRAAAATESVFEGGREVVEATPTDAAFVTSARSASARDEAALAADAQKVSETRAPDFSIAELGTDMGDPDEGPLPAIPDADFSLAEVGADLLDEPARVESVELGPLNFEVAEVGATIGDDSQKPAPEAPDTSHIQLDERA